MDLPWAREVLFAIRPLTHDEIVRRVCQLLKVEPPVVSRAIMEREPPINYGPFFQRSAFRHPRQFNLLYVFQLFFGCGEHEAYASVSVGDPDEQAHPVVNSPPKRRRSFVEQERRGTSNVERRVSRIPRCATNDSGL
jgi:hypothetical protein